MKQLSLVLLTIMAVFTPIRAALVATLVLILVDLITGLLAAHKSKEPITSAGIKRTVGKIVLYEVAICISFLVQTYLTGDLLPASKLVTSLVGMVELKSVLENLDIISGTSLFQVILSRIVQSQSDLDKK